MTSTAKIRRLITINGKRVSFDLTAGEWAAVERAAAAAGVRVSAWVNQQAAAAQDAGAGNLTAYVRTAATEAALAALAEMESRAALPPATGFEQANTPDDRDEVTHLRSLTENRYGGGGGSLTRVQNALISPSQNLFHFCTTVHLCLPWVVFFKNTLPMVFFQSF